MNEITELRELVGELVDLGGISSLEGWDNSIYRPEGGAEIGAKRAATLAKIIHEKTTNPRIGELVTALRDPAKLAQLSTVDKALVREMGRDYDHAKAVPEALVKEIAEITGKAHTSWVNARKAGTFHGSEFEKDLVKIVDLHRQKAAHLSKALNIPGSPYNALLDIFEPGLTTDQVDVLFANLKSKLVPLVKAINSSSKHPDMGFLSGKTFDMAKQVEFSKQLMKDMGFDMDRGRLDPTAHPFCGGPGSDDVRLGGRWFEDDPFSGMASTIHEVGHGLVEQGPDKELPRIGLSGATLGVHESQSRMWENVVGRSKAFWEHYLPELKKLFPKELDGVTLDQVYRAVNRVKPSFIRVEADEVTYNLHIMMRYELEKDLIEGKLEVKDLPKAWNQKVQDYFGITPSKDSEGMLQDVHWSAGLIGYFPTYTLGNLYSAQFFNQAKKEMPDLEDKIRKGELLSLRKWLGEKIHLNGRVRMPDQIVKDVTGEPLNANYFTDYLERKYNDLYDLGLTTSGATGTAKP